MLLGLYGFTGCSYKETILQDNTTEAKYKQIERIILNLMPDHMSFVKMIIKESTVYLTVKISRFASVDRFISNCERHPKLSRPILDMNDEHSWPLTVKMRITIG